MIWQPALCFQGCGTLSESITALSVCENNLFKFVSWLSGVKIEAKSDRLQELSG